MSLKTLEIEKGMKPFDHVACPVCGGKEFVELLPAGGVWCDRCNAKFMCRDTAGDPGLVVDCTVEHVHRPWLADLEKLIRAHGTAVREGETVADVLDQRRYGAPLPVYFYQVCKEPQADGSWTDVRRWNLCSLILQLRLMLNLNTIKDEKPAKW